MRIAKWFIIFSIVALFIQAFFVISQIVVSAQLTLSDLIEDTPQGYHSVLVVDKYLTKRCYKGRCDPYKAVVVKLDGNLGTKEIVADNQEFAEAVIGKMMNFPRHLVEPKTIKSRDVHTKLIILLFGVALLLCLAMFSLLIGEKM
jgi:hypothetical protein